VPLAALRDLGSGTPTVPGHRRLQPSAHDRPSDVVRAALDRSESQMSRLEAVS
jgi:hypothetical protein